MEDGGLQAGASYLLLVAGSVVDPHHQQHPITIINSHHLIIHKLHKH